MSDVSSIEQSLRQTLADAASFLDSIGETFWSSRLRRAAERAVLDVAEVMSWYGGMGSFNDLFIAGVNGHRVSPEAEGAANDKLDAFRERIYSLAAK